VRTLEPESSLAESPAVLAPPTLGLPACGRLSACAGDARIASRQALQYQHMYPLTNDVAAIAETLRASFMTGATAKKPIAEDEWESGSSG